MKKKTASSRQIRVLVTCGPTWVPIDDVRVISNVSSGEMGHLIAQAFQSRGAFVTIIEGPVTHTMTAGDSPLQGDCPLQLKGTVPFNFKIIKYRFFDELARVLKQELLKKYDIIIHAAAVSDFKAIRPAKRKISSKKALTLRLFATRKLVRDIKRLCPDSFLVGFKLESNLNPRNIFKTVKLLFTLGDCDLVVANTLTGGYRGFIVNADGEILSRAANKKALARNLVKSII